MSDAEKKEEFTVGELWLYMSLITLAGLVGIGVLSNFF